MANRFLNNIRINDEYTLPAADGSANQIIITDGAGNLSFVDTTTISVGESEQVHIACKNTSGVAISKGDPVYITGTVGTSYIVQVAAADASNSAKMPAVGLAESDLAINAEGFVIVSGVLKNLTTDPLSTGDGTPSSNDTVYVKAGGGLTKTKPTGSGNLIQNVGKVGRVNSANAGSLAVSTIMRTNDVPNLTTGKIWVGSSTYTTESGVVHLDESNGRMGIGTPSPSKKLEVVSNTTYDGIQISGSSIPTLGIIDTTNNAKFVAYVRDSDATIGMETNHPLTINTNNTERIRITNTGNVGIGTTSPQTELHVKGTNGWGEIRIEGQTFASGHGSSMEFYSEGTALADIYANTSKELIFRTNGTAEAMRIASNGKIDISGYGTEGAYLSSKGSFRIDIDNDNDHTDRSFIISSNNAASDLVTVKETGNVGIGNTTPQDKLDVTGVVNSSNNIVSNSTYTMFTGRSNRTVNDYGGLNKQYFKLNLVTPGPNTTGEASAHGFGDLRFQLANNAGSTAVADIMTLRYNGKVGIGTTTPKSKLQVNGGVQMADDTDTASADKVGTLRYRADANNSYVDMCMQTGASTYEWINIVQNNW